MREVNVYQAKTALSALLQAVAEGEEVVITKRNKPIARIVPYEPAKSRPTFGMSKKALERSVLTRADLAHALEPMTDEDLEAWQAREILAGLEDAGAEAFATEAEIQAAFGRS